MKPTSAHALFWLFLLTAVHTPLMANSCPTVVFKDSIVTGVTNEVGSPPKATSIEDSLLITIENPVAPDSNNQIEAGDLHLYLGFNQINLNPIECGCLKNTDTNGLLTCRFVLDHINRSEDEGWKKLLHSRKDDEWIKTSAKVSVGPSEGPVLKTKGGTILSFSLINQVLGGWAAFGLIATFGLFIYLVKNSNILRDAQPDPSSPNPSVTPSTQPRPWSLARCQMAFWFFLVLSSVIFLSLLFAEPFSAIPASILGLMGISSGTFLFAEVINPANQPNAVSPSAAVSQGFLTDILSDQTGVALHRFQLATWTVVLGSMFVAEVIGDLKMPDFDTTLLGLMGISAGTYIGFKIPSAPKPQ